MKKRLLTMTLLLVMLVSIVSAGQARVLERNMEGADVLEVQQLLQGLNYYGGALDGKFGRGTREAVRRFQNVNGLKVDGKVGDNTLKLLKLGNAKANVAVKMSFGSNGAHVAGLQKMLADTYYFASAQDGYYGADTVQAVKAFQESAGIKVDGIAGSVTYNALSGRTPAIFNGGTPQRSLRATDRGYDVYVLQNKLVSLGYLAAGSVSGYYNSDTVAAIKAFEATNGLTQTGMCSVTVLRAIWPQQYTATPTGGAKMGSSGSNVADIQLRLKAAGYLPGKVDGVFGVQTYNAVVAFQAAKGLKADGVVGTGTLAELAKISVAGLTPATPAPAPVIPGVVNPVANTPTYKLALGSNCTEVKILQNMLINLGLLSAGQDDGVYGKKTYDAVVAFQRAVSLKRDGVVGAKTWAALYARTSP